jgi:hypothetical protein
MSTRFNGINEKVAEFNEIEENNKRCKRAFKHDRDLKITRRRLQWATLQTAKSAKTSSLGWCCRRSFLAILRSQICHSYAAHTREISF